MSARSGHRARVIVTAVALWVGIGAVLFPVWWYDFFFEFRWSSPEYWATGVAFLWRAVERSPFVALVAAVCIYYLWRLRSVVSRFEVDKNWWKYSGVSLFCGVMSMAVWGNSFERRIAEWAESITHDVRAQSTPASHPYSRDVFDFAYIDLERIEMLWGQLQADIQLKEMETETTATQKVSASAGVDEVAKIGASDQQEQKQTGRYARVMTIPAKQAVGLIRHYAERAQLKDFGSLEINSESIRSWNEVADFMQKHGISYDDAKFEQVGRSLFSESFLKQRASLAPGSVAVVYGTFVATRAGDTIVLAHDFFAKPKMARIVFQTEPLFTHDTAFKASRNAAVEPETPYELAVFCRVLRTAESNGDLIVTVSPYAIWFL